MMGMSKQVYKKYTSVLASLEYTKIQYEKEENDQLGKEKGFKNFPIK